MRTSNARRYRGFSLIELVIVVVIIGIIAAIAIPRMSRGAEGAADGALKADLAVMRSALDLFVAEHVGTKPSSAANFDAEMTGKTDINGTAGAGPGFIYGPYLRAIPPLPVGNNKGTTLVKAIPPDGAGGAGWAYDLSTGDIFANSTDTDVDGKPYNTY